VTHAELRARLPAYAGGTLPDAEADEVRAHLAAGCTGCLGEVFTLPLGRPRPRPIRGLAAGARGRRLAVAVGAGALAVGATIGWTVRALRPPDAARDPVALAEVRAGYDRLATRVGALERAADVPAVATTTVPRPAAEATPRPAVPGIEDLLASPGVRVSAFDATPPAADARGYALWSPARGLVLVSTTGLPAAPAGATYRVRVLLDHRATVWVGELVPSPDGALVASVALPDVNAHVREVDLYRDPPGESVLSAALRP
jgi:hypothetical protein